jgi:membrane fusion protein (multidrug efflux system)
MIYQQKINYMELTQQEAKPNKKKLKKIIIYSVVALVLAWFGFQFYHILTYEETDNAQVEGDIVPIRTSVPGYIKTVNFQENQRVHKGQVLLQIDDRDLRAKVLQAEAAVENAKAARLQIGSNISASATGISATQFSADAMQQNIEVAKAKLWKAEADYERTKKLVALQGATPQQMDAVDAEKRVAVSQLELAEKQFQSSKKQTSVSSFQAQSVRIQEMVADAVIKQREAELTLARSQLDYATITAPYNGVVSKKNVEPGQYLQPGQLTCSIVGSDSVWLVANFKETQIHNMKIGQEASIDMDAYPGTQFTGKISSFSGGTGARFSLLPPDNATGNFVKVTQRIPVRILLDVRTSTGFYLAPGMNAIVSVRKK